MLKKLVGSVVLLAATATLAHAQVNAYSNITNFSGSTYANGGATVQNGDTITTLVADDITVAPGFGGRTVTLFTFTVANSNMTAVRARPIVRFYAADGTGGLPGAVIGFANYTAFTYAAGGVTTLSLGLANLVIPANGRFYAGLAFDNDSGATSATAAQLNNLGQGLYNPPTVGSSQDSYFQSGPATSATFAVTNPSGSLTSFGGNPPANFGWQFQVAPLAVPEPGTGVFLCIGGLSLAALTFARRRLA